MTGKKTKKEPKKKEEKETPSESQPQEKSQSREQELVETLQRLQAEFENFKRRSEREQSSYRQFAAQNVLVSLLPIVDNFRIALKSHENKKDEFYKGVELIYAQLFNTLKENGVEQIEVQEVFNPQLHEALLTEERKDLAPNTIIETLQEGYTLNGKVLRAAKVKVSKK